MEGDPPHLPAPVIRNTSRTLRAHARLSLVVFVATMAVACTDASSTMAVSDQTTAQLAAGGHSAAVTSDWIVLLDDSTRDAPGKSKKIVEGKGGVMKHTYQHGVKGFAARLNDADADALATEAGIRLVERDGIARISESVSATSWGLDRIDQRALPLNGIYTFTNRGTGVRVYILDTGILTSHQEFAGRATGGYTAIADGNGTNDCNGHGTHVAGTVGGGTTGVARDVSLIAVRVLDCGGSGSWSGVIAGLDWVTSQKQNNPSVPMAANMSLGGGISSAVNDAVARAVAAGVTMAVAAGNSSADACSASPASTPSALTVGATGSNDARASYSNYGTCLDIFAPGSGITSSYIGGPAAYASLSGTSMASPHVAGVAALILGANTSYTPAQVRTAMLDSATASIVTSEGSGSPRVLLNTAFGSVATPPPAVITLTVTKQKSGRWNGANLQWSGATTTNVDVYRNGNRITSTANDGQYLDNKLGNGTWTYKVCNSGSTTACSPSASITY